jgi:hypothetical protein
VERSFVAARKGGRISLRDEVVKRLNSRGRVDEGVKVEPEADIANLRAAVQELQETVVYLAEELDRRDAAAVG